MDSHIQLLLDIHHVNHRHHGNRPCIRQSCTGGALIKVCSLFLLELQACRASLSDLNFLVNVLDCFYALKPEQKRKKWLVQRQPCPVNSGISK